MEFQPSLKRLFWMASSRKDLKSFPAEVQDEMEESSGNVFADLGLSDPEERLAKAVG